MEKETMVKLGDIMMNLYDIAEDDDDCKEFATKMMGKISDKINSERDKK